MGASENSPPQERSLGDLPPTVLDHLLEGCQVIGRDWRYLYANEAAARHGRSTPASLVGRTMMDAYPGIERTEIFAVLRRSMEERTPALFENAFVFPDGTTGWFELRFEPVPEGVCVLSIDITQRKLAEISLERRTRALRTLSRSNQAVMRAADEEQIIREVAHVVVHEGGYPKAWIGLVEPSSAGVRRVTSAAAATAPPEGALAQPSGAGGEEDLAERVAQSGEPELVRFRSEGSAWERAALEHGLSSCLALPVRGRDEVLGVLVIYGAEPDAFDESERGILDEVALDLGYGITAVRTRRAELEAIAKLEAFRQRARAVFDHAPHATFVWQKAPDGMRLIELNEAARALLGDAVSTIAGTPAADVARFFPGLEEDLARCLDERATGRREIDCTLPGPGGRLRMVLTYGHVPPDRVVVHAQDVTRERRTEARLHATERLEAVGRLAGGVAHDFNNLLSVILTSAEFALTRLAPSDPIREDLEQVLAAGQKAAQLTKQLLAFGRRQVLEPQPTDLNCVLRDLREILERALGADIALELALAPDLGTVMADASQVERILVNLALNARDAMPSGGRVVLETSNAVLDEHHSGHEVVRPGPYVCLAVTDTGTGMPPEMCERIFEPFFTTKAGKGTGLGLSSVYGIVKQSDGYIWVTSEVGRGTTFRIYLPRVEVPAAARKRAGADSPLTGRETVLIVEDEEGVRRASERILKAVGYRVLTAASGPEALQIAARHVGEIDLLLTDVVMPGMSGPEVAARLEKERPNLAVLYMSGYADEAISRHGAPAGGVQFIPKPFSVEQLRRKVREVLDG
jgi:signal transduction histidine kinase